MTALLEVAGLHVRYGRVEALFGASLKIARGQIVTVVGSNGAGKSTLLNAIAALLPSTGEIRFDGKSTAGLTTEDLIERGVCLVPETRDLFPAMSVEDNLLLGAYARRSSGRGSIRSAMAEMFDLFPRLRERRAQAAGTLSGGERQMAALARALMSRPKLLMLDEPSLGLAPLIVEDVFRIIRSLREAGVSILLVEQNAQAALNVADYGYVLEMGEVAVEGPSAALRADQRIVDTYLGIGRSSYVD